MEKVLLRPFLLGAVGDRRELVLENAFLRYQLRVLQRRRSRILLNTIERGVILWFSKRIKNWQESLLIIRPETLIRWHRRRFGLYWSKVAKDRRGRPLTNPRTIQLIQKLSRENRLWGAPRIHSELMKLGITVSQATVEKYMLKRHPGSSQGWKTFLRNHAKHIVAVDCFTVPTLTFKVLSVLVILSHDRRRILHYGVARSVSESWTHQQLREAFTFEQMPKFIVHDGAGNFRNVSRLGVRDFTTSSGSPWQNGIAERVIGSIRRECLDHLIVLNERHLEKVLRSYVDYYNRSRLHLSLNRDSPEGRAVFARGKVVRFREVGGLHHRYERRVA